MQLDAKEEKDEKAPVVKPAKASKAAAQEVADE